MKTALLALAFVALTLAAAATPALAVPSCYVPRGGGSHITFNVEIGNLSEADRAAFYEQQLRARGIDASNTRFWNECIQTFVTENGHFTMRFYDPYSLEEVPVD
jgi:hypothetical protein